ncbi:MAG: hypothetical protein KJ718_03665 [Nanoarchaeota archaeon]|nr:hypothetical protein [Nanoarchaeota archaeon]MBU1051628.1 hypothetical protein [Nanoarchaeota archaeon]MBU1988830.1 hypothetical protein [Nanoarchaeota archaeon]
MAKQELHLEISFEKSRNLGSLQEYTATELTEPANNSDYVFGTVNSGNTRGGYSGLARKLAPKLERGCIKQVVIRPGRSHNRNKFQIIPASRNELSVIQKHLSKKGIDVTINLVGEGQVA